MKENSLSLIPWKFELPKSWFIRFSPRFFTYSPHHPIYLETSKYILKTADTTDELISVFKMRHRIFLGNYQKRYVENYDVDQYDSECDHLIIIDREKNEICGTYRILCSKYVESFYSENEFTLQNFLNTPGVKVELGRACIHHAHRNGNVIDLLWKGIAAYCEKVEATALFGCSSIHTTDHYDIKSLQKYLEEKQMVSSQYAIEPTPEFTLRAASTDEDLWKVDSERGKSLLPSLLRSYMTAGAKVFGAPAFDEEFHCFDYLTILEMKNVTDGFKRRYFTYLS